jgi:hypothetical protein
VISELTDTARVNTLLAGQIDTATQIPEAQIAQVKQTVDASARVA